MFRFYSNTVSQASKAVAQGVLVIGLLLLGFGTLILAMPDVFAFLAAAVFFFIGFGCVITAVKIYWTQRAFNRTMDAMHDEPFRQNVNVRPGNRFEDSF